MSGIWFVFGKDGRVIAECLSLTEAEAVAVQHEAIHISYVPDGASEMNVVCAHEVEDTSPEGAA
jgi:hypothetical protein